MTRSDAFEALHETLRGLLADEQKKGLTDIKPLCETGSEATPEFYALSLANILSKVDGQRRLDLSELNY